MSERDYIGLLDGVHHLVKAPIVPVWEQLNTRVSHCWSSRRERARSSSIAARHRGRRVLPAAGQA
ncbi:hypothetical protein ABZW30_40030 [Kitasatospora sp. NPDC004669]|uniref:hypothetical protein n=1 Tax=Kitasatospora sp. NPDC004669 TaxID=3154555 RepID=UPI0033A45733